MKRSIRRGFIGIIAVLIAVPAFAQLNIGYVNTDRIMQEYEDAQDAQQQLNREAQTLQTRYDEMLTELDSLQRSFSQQRFVMSEERRQQKQTEIQQLQQKIQQFQMENVGPQGQLYGKQEQIMGPVLQKIQTAIDKVARDGSYDYVLDSVGGNILYAEPKHDITDDVLYELRRGTAQSTGSGQ